MSPSRPIFLFFQELSTSITTCSWSNSVLHNTPGNPSGCHLDRKPQTFSVTYIVTHSPCTSLFVRNKEELSCGTEGKAQTGHPSVCLCLPTQVTKQAHSRQSRKPYQHHSKSPPITISFPHILSLWPDVSAAEVICQRLPERLSGRLRISFRKQPST